MNTGTLRHRLEQLERQDSGTPGLVRFITPGHPDYGRTHDDDGRPIRRFTITVDGADRGESDESDESSDEEDVLER